jgi:hypothetical protein
MRVLQITALLVTVLVLSAQAVRHIYVAYVEPRTSVLDKYNESDAGKAVREAKSLAELLTLYDPARKRVDELDKELKAAKESKRTREEQQLVAEKFRDDHRDEYRRASELGNAITDWEHKTSQVLELRVFWAFGIGLFLIGAVLLATGRQWLGVSLIIPGIVEMLWWTSPSIRLDGCPVEFDRLLHEKILLTLITLGVVIVAWLLNEFRNRATGDKTPLNGRG